MQGLPIQDHSMINMQQLNNSKLSEKDISQINNLSKIYQAPMV
jgi:hypothetical protein